MCAGASYMVYWELPTQDKLQTDLLQPPNVELILRVNQLNSIQACTLILLIQKNDGTDTWPCKPVLDVQSL